MRRPRQPLQHRKLHRRQSRHRHAERAGLAGKNHLQALVEIRRLQRCSICRRQPDRLAQFLNIARNAIGHLNHAPRAVHVDDPVAGLEPGDDERREISLVNGLDPEGNGALEERVLLRIEDCVHAVAHAAKEYKRHLVQELNPRTKRGQDHVGIRDVGDILELIEDNAELERLGKLSDHLNDLFDRFDALRGLDVDRKCRRSRILVYSKDRAQALDKSADLLEKRPPVSALQHGGHHAAAEVAFRLHAEEVDVDELAAPERLDGLADKRGLAHATRALDDNVLSTLQQFLQLPL